MQSSDLGLLVVLDALLQESSVTRAARRVGLSTPATSHALARIRDRFGDPILVRAGRGMVLTPRAEELRPLVRSAVVQAEQVLAAPEPFSPHTVDRAFVVSVTDYVLTLLGSTIDRLAREEAPGLVLRFVPNTLGDAAALRDGATDLAVGIYGDLPPELKMRELLTDRFVCALRRAHPAAKKRLTLARFCKLDHVQVAPRGQPGGYVDDLLAERGRQRRIARTTPFFGAALALVAEADYVLTVSERIARRAADARDLVLLPPPLPLEPYALNLLWHPRMDADPAHAWLRDLFVRAAKQEAGDKHRGARRRLGHRDPTTGASRRRRR
jgi:DNA-binding transcriptional LysR family regulator